MTVKENPKGSRKSRRFRSLLFSIAATYLTLCFMMVVCALLFLLFSSSSLRSKLEGIAASRAETAASDTIAEMDNFIQLTEVISSSPLLHSLPDSLQKDLAHWIPEANRLRVQLVSARTNYGSDHLSVLGVYYPDTSVFITDSTIYTPDMMDYYPSRKAPNSSKSSAVPWWPRASAKSSSSRATAPREWCASRCAATFSRSTRPISCSSTPLRF